MTGREGTYMSHGDSGLMGRAIHRSLLLSVHVLFLHDPCHIGDDIGVF